jgi:hypothetical protein
MLLLLLLLRACVHEPACTSMHHECCVHACVRGCLSDRHHVSADLLVGVDPGVENRIFI